jgi:hypothetical protein
VDGQKFSLEMSVSVVRFGIARAPFNNPSTRTSSSLHSSLSPPWRTNTGAQSSDLSARDVEAAGLFRLLSRYRCIVLI